MDPLADLELALAGATVPVARVQALNALASHLTKTGAVQQALAYLDEALALVATTDDPRLRAETVHTQARCHFYQADFMRALELLLDATRLYQSCDDLAGATLTLAGVGTCQHRLGAHDDAAASLLRALDSARSLGLDTLQTNIHNSLGSAFILAGRIDEAARYLVAGSDRAQASANRSLLTKLLMNRSLLSKRRGDDLKDSAPQDARQAYEQSLAEVQRATDLARECANRYDELHCLGQTGTALRLLGRHDEAESVLQATLALGQQVNERHVQAEALVELGRLRLQQSQPDLAQGLLVDAAALARGIQARSVLADACQVLSQVLEALGDLPGALAAYKEFHAVREEELAGSRKHVSAASELWLQFQDASRRASEYRDRALHLAEVSERDPLTGLLNRRGLTLHVDAALDAARLQGVAVTVALIDVDHFKQINDGHSHAVGDSVLRRLGELMRGHCRQDDLAVRWGGDEFLLVLSGVDPAAAARVLGRLKAASDADPMAAPGLRVSLSIGLAGHRSGMPIDSTIAAADAALYQAKHQGRDRIVVQPGP